MRALWQDARYGLRMLLRTPGYAVVMVLTLALGIGVTTAISSMVNGVLLRPLAYPQSQRLVFIGEFISVFADKYPILPVCARHFLEWRQRCPLFEGLSPVSKNNMTMTGQGKPERWEILEVSANLFGVLRVPPALGRVFTAADEGGSGSVAVISAGFAVTYYELTESPPEPPSSTPADVQSSLAPPVNLPQAETQWNLPTGAYQNRLHGSDMTALIFQGSSADSTTSGRSESAAAVECGGMMGSLMRGVAKSLSPESRENRRKLQTGPMGGSYSHARPQGGTDLNRSADPNSSRLAPAAGELLDKYTRALDSLCSTITRAEIRLEYDLAFAADWPEPFYRGMRDKGVRYERTEFRTDGKRLHSRMYTWAHIAPQWPDVPEKEAHYNCLNFADGTLYQNNTNLYPSTRGLVGLFKQPALKIRDTEVHLTGYPLQSDDRLDTVLRRARSLSVRSKTERVGDADCHVVDADTDHGRISVWIDPTHGYHLAKMQAKETQGDLYWGKPLPNGQSLNAAIEITHFEKIGSVWVPMDADISLDKRLGPGAYTIQKTRYRRTEVLVNPDHDALGSFDNPLENPKNDSLLKNGTYVIRGNEPIRYRWQDGKLVLDERQPKTKRARPAPQGRGEVP